MTAKQSYTAHTLRLFAARIEFGNDSDEAERIRETLDSIWRKLSEEERNDNELGSFLNAYFDKHKLETA